MSAGAARCGLAGLGGRRRRGLLVGSEQAFEFIEAAGPELLVFGEPLVRGGEGRGFEAAEVCSSAAGAAEETGVLEGLEVLGGGGQRHVERLGELGDGALTGGEGAEDAPARGVGECPEDAVEAGGMFNHVVEYTRGGRDGQPFG